MAEDADFSLFETVLLRPGRRIRGLSLHIERLAKSASALGFKFDESECLSRLQSEWRRLPVSGEFRARIDLSRAGEVSIKSAAIEPLPTGRDVPVLLSEKTLSLDEMALVAHKTSFRATYDRAIRYAQAQGAFDVLFFNSSGELTEGARTNVFVRVDGSWRTPRLSCGVLPGTMRARVMRRWPEIIECSIDRDALLRAERVLLSNAVRGLLPVLLIGEMRRPEFGS